MRAAAWVSNCLFYSQMDALDITPTFYQGAGRVKTVKCAIQLRQPLVFSHTAPLGGFDKRSGLQYRCENKQIRANIIRTQQISATAIVEGHLKLISWWQSAKQILPNILVHHCVIPLTLSNQMWLDKVKGITHYKGEVWGGWSLFQLTLRRKQRTVWTGHQSITHANTFQTFNQFRITHSSLVHVLGQWKKKREPKDVHVRQQACQNPKPSFCEATMVITVTGLSLLYY